MADDQGPSNTVLSEIPGRALTFLRAASTSVPIRASLAMRGYTAEDHQEGWNLLLQVSGFRENNVAAATESIEVRQAIAGLDAWDEPNFRIIRASLGRRHKEQAKFVMDGLNAATGAAAVLGIAALLDRLDALENDKDRKATRKADHAALETLEKRGIGKKERERLRSLVKTAARGVMPEAEAAASSGAKNALSEAEEVSDKAVRALYEWHHEWAETAKAEISRRDHLIRLGLAKRKKGEKPAESKGGGNGAGPG